MRGHIRSPVHHPGSTSPVMECISQIEMPKISGLTGHWDFADRRGIELNGADVSRVKDKSGNGYHLSQAMAAAQPTYNQVVNKYPVPRFTRPDDEYLRSASGVRNEEIFDPFGSDGFSLFLVANTISFSTGSFDSLWADTNQIIMLGSNVTAWRWQCWNGAAYENTDAGGAAVGLKVFVATYDGSGNYKLRVNRNEGTSSSGSGPNNGTGQFEFGAPGAQQGDVEFDGCEAATWSRKLSNAEISQLELYASDKWGVPI